MLPNGDGEVFSVPITGGTPTVLASFSAIYSGSATAAASTSVGTLEGLLAKLLDALPQEQREELRLLQDRVDFMPSPVISKGQEWVEPLIEAFRDEHVIEMTYRTLRRGREERRRVDPYCLRFFAGAWYMVGYDHQTKHFPVFNLARVGTLEVTEESYMPREFSAAEYFRHAVGITVGGPPRSVRVLLTGRAAKAAGERIWPGGFTYTPKGEGAGVLAGRVSKLDDLLAWAEAVGGDATILPDGSTERDQARRLEG